MPLVYGNFNICIFMQVQQIRCWTLVEFICGFSQKWGGNIIAGQLLSWFSITSRAYISLHGWYMIRQICGANLWNIDFNLKFQYKYLNEVNISYLVLRTNLFSFAEMFSLIVNTPFNKMICNYTSLGPNCIDMWVPHGK